MSRRPSRMVELVDEVGPTERVETLAQQRARLARENARNQMDRAEEIREHQARKVDALYRAHLLRAAADRMISTLTVPGGAAARRDARAAARTQEIRAEQVDR
jgi:hypothetical protein